MEYKNIGFDIKNGVAYVMLIHPESRNPVSNPVKKELIKAFEYCNENEAVRAVVIRGKGGVFSAGGDMKDMKSRLDRGEYGTWVSCELGGALNKTLLELKKPTIAVVEGAAAGSGLCLAMSCDFQLVDEAAKMSFAFVNISYVPDSGTALLVTRAVGTMRAKEILMTGKRFTGKQAAEWGLMTEAMPKEALDECLEKYLNKFANGPTVAYGYIKAMINANSYYKFDENLENEIKFQTICEKTEDHKEAVYAFFDKRKPDFKGC